MSWECWSEYGYGVDENTIYKVQMEKLFEFVRKHRNCAEIQRYFQDEFDLDSLEDLDAFEEAIDNYETEECYTGFGGIIAAVMSEETDIPLAYLYDETDHYGIVLYEQYPWNHRESVRNLTMEELNNIFKEYFAELGVEITDKDIDSMKFEFCG